MSRKKSIKTLIGCINSVNMNIDTLSLRLNAFEEQLNKSDSVRGVNQDQQVVLRINGLTPDQWKFVQENNYLCGFSKVSINDALYESIHGPTVIHRADINEDGTSFFFRYDDVPYEYCVVRIMVGERQPCFGEGEPDLNDCTLVIVKLRDGEIGSPQSLDVLNWGWSATSEDDKDIVEFTLFK